MTPIDSTNEAVEPNEPQKLDASEFVQAVDAAKAEIAGEKAKKRPRAKKVDEAKESTASAAPKPNGGDGKAKKSAAKEIEDLKAEAAPAPDPMNRQAGKAIPLNPRISDRFKINLKNITIGTHRELLKIPVRPPNKFEHFRVHPTLCLDVMIIRPKDSQETYVIDACMHAVLKRWIVPATIRLAITSDETHIVWPLRVPANSDEKDFAAWTSARSIAHDAVNEWCSLIWNRAQMAYDKGTADIAFDAPVWNEFTTEPFDDAIDLMIEKIKDNFVEDMSHPLVKRLGKQAKEQADAAANKKDSK